MSETPGSAPQTGEPEIDELLADVGRLGELPVTDHHDVLTAVHEGLRRRLDADVTGSD